MISLPNCPDTPYTAKSFAEKISDVTVLIRYTSEFESYLPGYDTDDGFPIEGGQGYIINVTAGKSVDFTGTVWDNAKAPLFMSDNSETWAFVIAGVLPSELDNAGELFVTARNINRNLTINQPLNSQQFSLIFVDVSRRAVVEVDDPMEITCHTARWQTHHNLGRPEAIIASLTKLSQARTHLAFFISASLSFRLLKRW